MPNESVVYERGQHTSLEPDMLAAFSEESALWYESREEVEAGLDWGERKAEMLRWVRREMGRRLTGRERRMIELHYFKALSIAETARKENVDRSTASRALRRAITKLRQAAENADAQNHPLFLRCRRG